MKKILSFVLGIMIGFSACKSSENLVNKGQYDEAVQLAVKKLQRNRNNEKQAMVLARAYPKAVEKDLERIKFLKQEGQPGNWDEIYALYLRLKKRQELVETVTPLTVNGRTIDFPHQDYDAALIEAKNRAAQYHYALGKKLMRENNKFAYRRAYKEFQKAKFYNPSYLDIDRLMAECLDKGTTYVLIVPVNKTIYRLPDDYLYNLVNFPLDKLNSQWIIYHNQDVRNGNYDMFIYVVLKGANISADKEIQREYTETKKVQTGYFIKRDANGNVVVDSNGNPVKVPKYSTITCKVREFRQLKVANIVGEIEYYDAHSKQVVNVLPIAAEHRFENIYGMANGNLKACSDRTNEIINNRPLPYPNNLDMILAAGETLKNVIWQAIYEHRGYLNQRY